MGLSPAVGHVRECPHSETRYFISFSFWCLPPLSPHGIEENWSSQIVKTTAQPQFNESIPNNKQIDESWVWHKNDFAHHLPIQTYQTKPNLPNQTKPTKPNLQNPTYQTYKTKATKPEQPKQGFRQDSEAATINELTDQSKRIFQLTVLQADSLNSWFAAVNQL